MSGAGLWLPCLRRVPLSVAVQLRDADEVLSSELGDEDVGRLVITPSVVAAGGAWVALTPVPFEREAGFPEPGWVDQWTNDNWVQIGGFVRAGADGVPGSLHRGPDPFKGWGWTADLPVTHSFAPATVWRDLDLPPGLYRLRYPGFAGSLAVVDHPVPDPWTDMADPHGLTLIAEFDWFIPSNQRRLQISCRLPLSASDKIRPYQPSPRRLDDVARIWTWTGTDWVHLLDAAVEPSDTIGWGGSGTDGPQADDHATVALPPLPAGPYQVRCGFQGVGELIGTFLIAPPVHPPTNSDR